MSIITHELQLLADQEKQHIEQKKTVENNIERHAQQQKQHELLTFKLDQLKKEEKEHHNNVSELVRTWRTTHAQQRTITDLTELEQKKQNLINNINIHQQLFQQRLEYKEQYLKLKEKIQELEQQFHLQQTQHIQQKKIMLERSTSEQLHTKTKINDLEKQQHIYTQEVQQLQTSIHHLQIQKNTDKNLVARPRNYRKTV